ncbi:hypothetical protein MKX01_030348 [Papaver californicum]|nr:hypothetical protein MKX01_030348 [Papaver californicum]
MDKWIDEYFERLSLRVTYKGSPKQLIYPRSRMKKQHIDLEVSREMLFQEATCVADDWTDVHRKYNDRRSFPTFLWLLQMSGLDWHKYEFDKARLLGSFLDHLIKIQQEQRVVAYNLFEHLEQLRESDAASFPAFASNAVDDDGDRDICPFIRSKHTVDPYMWPEKHLFDSLYIMSRESILLLRKLEASRSSSPLLVEESHKILQVMVLFIPYFKNSKVKLSDTVTDVQLDQISVSINQILGVVESVQAEFVAMHRTVAEITYMIGDAFTTGGAGMNGSNDVTSPGTSSKQDDQVVDFKLEDFPWDKHNVLDDITIDVNNPSLKWMDVNPNYEEFDCSDSEDEFI